VRRQQWNNRESSNRGIISGRHRMHIVTLSFDDGFTRSSVKTAEIYEKHGLRANMNIVAGPNWLLKREPERAATIQVGDFGLWNELLARGHDIQPHSFSHLNVSQVDLAAGKAEILRCLDTFDEKLAGFDRQRAIYHFAYNRTTPEIEAWLPSEVRAFRGGFVDCGINDLPTRDTRVLRTTGFGPENCEQHLDGCIAELLKRPSGWLVYNTHGLDGEGWGPIGSDYLSRLLDRLLKVDSVRVLPTGEVFRRIDAGEPF
jgi:peptidoglycan/xylan/chitin deacetylase (PgdA/CDA1 family)